MKVRFLFAIVLAATLTGAAAQNPGSMPAAGQSGLGDGYGQRAVRGFAGAGMMGRGVMGTVTKAAADHYTIKTDSGDIYTVRFSANTRIFKMPAGMRGPGQGSEGRRMGWRGSPPEPLKASDIKIGDVIEARGEADSVEKSVGAVAVVQIDPEQVRQIRELEANYGKTWLVGRVTAIEGVKVTLIGSVDNASHDIMADDNTTFRRRREPITLADIQVGDTVRAEGSLKGGVFTATSVAEMGGMPGNGSRPAIPSPSPR